MWTWSVTLHTHASIYPSIHSFIHSSIRPSFCLLVGRSVSLTIYLSIHLSIYPFIYLFLHVHVCILSLSLYIYIYNVHTYAHCILTHENEAITVHAPGCMTIVPDISLAANHLDHIAFIRCLLDMPNIPVKPWVRTHMYHELGIQLGYDLGKSQAGYWENPMRDSASTLAAHVILRHPPKKKQWLAYPLVN